MIQFNKFAHLDIRNSPQFREWKANSELIVEKMKSKNILFGSGSSNFASPRHGPTSPPENKQTLCYEEVKRVEDFKVVLQR